MKTRGLLGRRNSGGGDWHMLVLEIDQAPAGQWRRFFAETSRSWARYGAFDSVYVWRPVWAAADDFDFRYLQRLRRRRNSGGRRWFPFYVWEEVADCVALTDYAGYRKLAP